MRNLFAIILGASFLMSWSGYADAHAGLERSQPGADATLEASPKSVQLWFTKAVEPSFSTVRVTDQGGNQVDTGNVAVSANDPKLLEVGVSPLIPGIYKVIWKIVALDGHKAKGEFSFSVK